MRNVSLTRLFSKLSVAELASNTVIHLLLMGSQLCRGLGIESSSCPTTTFTTIRSFHGLSEHEGLGLPFWHRLTRDGLFLSRLRFGFLAEWFGVLLLRLFDFFKTLRRTSSFHIEGLSLLDEYLFADLNMLLESNFVEFSTAGWAWNSGAVVCELTIWI